MTKEERIYNGVNTISSIQEVLGKLDKYMKKKKTGPLSYTIYKNNLKMD